MANDTVDMMGSVSTEKVTYRAYVKLSTDKDGKTIVDKIVAKAGAAQLDKETGLPTNWAKAEKDGFTAFNENEFIRYAIKSQSAFELLVPEETQRVYIIQAGLNYLMNAKANSASVAMKDGTPEPEPMFNQVSIDLRVGTDDDGSYSINEPPSRRQTTDEEKLIKLLKATGKTDEQIAMILAVINASQAAPADEEVEVA